MLANIIFPPHAKHPVDGYVFSILVVIRLVEWIPGQAEEECAHWPIPWQTGVLCWNAFLVLGGCLVCNVTETEHAGHITVFSFTYRHGTCTCSCMWPGGSPCFDDMWTHLAYPFSRIPSLKSNIALQHFHKPLFRFNAQYSGRQSFELLVGKKPLYPVNCKISHTQIGST